MLNNLLALSGLYWFAALMSSEEYFSGGSTAIDATKLWAIILFISGFYLLSILIKHLAKLRDEFLYQRWLSTP